MEKGKEEWRKMADTQKMSPEDVKAVGVENSRRPPGQRPGEVLHQRRSLPFSLTAMFVGGFFVVGAISYFTLYLHKKPDRTAGDVARVTVNAGDPTPTRK